MERMRTGVFIVAAIVAALVGCGTKSGYRCAESVQCASDGVQGVCEPQGYCSFPDSMCPGGRRFDTNAGDVSGQCVMVDAGSMFDGANTCGTIGGSCCASGAACVETSSCVSGTCTSCIADVVMGRHTVCVIKTDSTVWCAGENQFGQLGFGLAGPSLSSWNQVRDSNGAFITDATAGAIGWESACVIRASGTVWCWGIGGDGQLGRGMTSNTTSAVQVETAPATPLMGIVQLGLGTDFACGRDSTDRVWCWGDNQYNEIGDGTVVDRTRAVHVLDTPGGAAMTGALDLSVGRHHACVRKANNAIWCWGRNTDGQIGDGSTAVRPNPVNVGTGTTVVAGQMYSCILRTDNTVWCSGASWRNRLGNGANNYDVGPGSEPTPVQVVTQPGGPAFTGATTIVGLGTICALMPDTTVMCWGDSPHGQSGTGAGSVVPTAVVARDGTTLTGVDRVRIRNSHACAHKSDGTWHCWGRNTEGEFGDGTFTNYALAKPLRFTCP